MSQHPSLDGRGVGQLVKLLEKTLPAFLPTVLSPAAKNLSAIIGVLFIVRGIIPPSLWSWIKAFPTSSITIASDDHLYDQVLGYLKYRNSRSLTERFLYARTIYAGTIENDTNEQSKASTAGFGAAVIDYFCEPGNDWFWHERRLFHVVLQHQETRRHSVKAQPDDPRFSESLTITCMSRSADHIKHFLETCQKHAYDQDNLSVQVLAWSDDFFHPKWKTKCRKPVRPLDTIHCDESQMNQLISNIEQYLDPATEQMYRDKCIPYRRGYLLHGPPGTGKTTLSEVLAGRFLLPLYRLDLPQIENDKTLVAMFLKLPSRCLVLMEDIDAVGMQREYNLEDMPGRHRGCTLSGLLNVLDGVDAQEGRIVFMTSNFPDKLDDALVREGRIDLKVEFSYINKEAAKKMFLRIYGPWTRDYQNLSEAEVESLEGSASQDFNDTSKGQDPSLIELAERFASKIPEGKLTPAKLQSFFTEHLGKPDMAMEQADAWVEKTIAIEAEKKERREKAAAAAATAAAARADAMLTADRRLRQV
ncbi:P-loop containing nucleoside triphosphate hydrolase protein [Whalleya microplaca]|nr:P-loop containing nucleoside triphosphate hydrolase protein [Whalleya microplaca]